MSNEIDVAISIVSFNTRELLRRCLHSLETAAIGPSHSITVLDNGSSDGSAEMVGREFPSVDLFPSPVNLGFGRGNNKIIARTRSRYVLVLNPDLIAREGAIDRMVRYMDRERTLGALGCTLRNLDGSLQSSCRRFPRAGTFLFRVAGGGRLFPRAKCFRDYFMTDWDHADTASVDWIMGSCMLLRRTALEDVGGFDEGFFMYYEDVDLCIRLWRAWGVCYFPEVEMSHRHQQESHRVGALRLKVIHLRSAYRFFRKHGLRPRRPTCR